MDKQLLGRFYLRLTSNGNLIGEFSNNISLRVQTESADRTSGEPPDHFDGTFRSTWVEQDATEPRLATLVITRIGLSPFFDLKWAAGKDKFRGQAMAAEGLLMGDYQKA